LNSALIPFPPAIAIVAEPYLYGPENRRIGGRSVPVRAAMRFSQGSKHGAAKPLYPARCVECMIADTVRITTEHGPQAAVRIAL